MANTSTTVSHRMVQSRLSSAWVLWATAILCSLATTPLTHAAGCHSQDRPIIYGTLSFETYQGIQHAPPIARAPSVLTHPRCGEETPLGSGSSTVPALPALLHHSGGAVVDSSESLPVQPPREHSQPSAMRLDRPPR